MRVLIIDDSRAMRLVLRRALRRRPIPITDVDEAESPMAAWPLLRDGVYDLILSDWNMPDMTGLELLKRVRKSQIETPFGFVTVECSQESLDAARDAGASFMVSKPFTEAGLFRAIAPLLSS